jgi:hypothetical protein
MPARLDMARYVRLVASVLVVLDRTFDDALREFSCDILRDLRISASLSPTEIHARFRCAFIIPSRASML